MACYMAKQDGRNRIHAATPSDEDIASRRGESESVNRIRAALDNDLFRLHGQIITPVRDTGTSKTYIEILLRMMGKNGELVAPGAFIPVAERYNLMPAIDRWVVKYAVKWLTQQSGRAELPILMLNLSGQSLTDEKFLEFVLKSIRSATIPAQNICFEITETAAVANLSKANEFIDKLKALGCRFALDDFGSGFSSFSYLKKLPVDFLKIDGSFIKDIAEDPIDYAMVKSINEIGQVLGKKTIAEFVENQAILEKLEALGVDYAQGYGIARPQPLDLLGRTITHARNDQADAAGSGLYEPLLSLRE